MDPAVSGSFPSPPPGVAPLAAPTRDLDIEWSLQKKQFPTAQAPHPLEILAFGFWQEGLFAHQVSMNKDFFLPFFSS